jgi:hypothetical protein
MHQRTRIGGGRRVLVRRADHEVTLGPVRPEGDRRDLLPIGAALSAGMLLGSRQGFVEQ